jgi:dGTPase
MMNWKQLLNTTRLGHRTAKAEAGRSPFNSDHDKVIFSGAFRRLARKTQVHPLVTNDHVHNRLTHSLEVACVGRSLGIRVGQALEEKRRLPFTIQPTDVGDIVQTACLAHDIGNPPFGHTGEEAIRYWFQHEGRHYLNTLSPEEAHDLMHFEGNAQGLRVLVASEYHSYDGGMRLTYASLASFIKYPWTSLPAVQHQRPKSDKYGVYQSELDIFHEIAGAVGLQALPDADWFCRHPLVHLMEAADDFCYGLLDLEDGFEMGLLTWDEVFEIFKPALQANKLDELTQHLQQVRARRRPPLIRGKIISAFIESATQAFIQNEEAILNGEHQSLLALCDEPVQQCVHAAKTIARDKIFSHPRKVEVEIGAYSIISTILEVMCEGVEEWVRQPQALSFRSKRVLDLIDEDSFPPQLKAPRSSKHSLHYLALMRVIDFVSGMTDHYATYLAKQFRGMGES